MMPSVSEFLIERLENAGVKHIYAVPGDYVLGFLPKLQNSKKISLINNADEAGAGFAADGYARISGIGCVVATYNVGALKLCNAIAGAYAERSPVVVISGAPGVNERQEPPLHHVVNSFDLQQHIFKKITCDQVVLDNPTTAGYDIDKVFESLRYHKRPVYIELPRDVANQAINYDVYTIGTPKQPQTDKANLEDALREVCGWINEAKKPVILAGVEVARFGLGKELIKFAEKHNIPVATTLLSKSVVNELHPLFLGVYAGSNSSLPIVREMVESSDCLLVVGEVITEATFGYRPNKTFQKRDMITCTVGCLKVRNHHYPDVAFSDFCRNLFKKEVTKRELLHLENKKVPCFKSNPDAKLTTARLLEKINSILDENSLVIADAGDSLLGACDMIVPNADTFLGPAFYLSMGFAIPAALGAKFARPKCRPIVIVGDGAFQMSFSEISTMLRWKQNPIIFVLNNRGYTTERMILDGKFNDILDWEYHNVSALLGSGIGIKVTTETELDSAVSKAIAADQVSVLNCIVDPMDISPALKRIGEALAKKAR